MQHHFFPAVLAAGLLTWAAGAGACPTIGGLADVNCDGVHKVVFLGDSVVSGWRDAANGSRGGYPLRIKKSFPLSKVVNFGIPSNTTARMLTGLSAGLWPGPRARAARTLQRADIVIIDVGRNDYWSKEVTPGMAVSNLVRIVKLLKSKLGQGRPPPVVAVATLIPSNRSYQDAYIQEFNGLLLKHRSAQLPAYVRFDRMPRRWLHADQLHPTAAGYDYLAGVAARFIAGRAQALAGSH